MLALVTAAAAAAVAAGQQYHLHEGTVVSDEFCVADWTVSTPPRVAEGACNGCFAERCAETETFLVAGAFQEPSPGCYAATLREMTTGRPAAVGRICRLDPIPSADDKIELAVLDLEDPSTVLYTARLNADSVITDKGILLATDVPGPNDGTLQGLPASRVGNARLFLAVSIADGTMNGVVQTRTRDVSTQIPTSVVLFEKPSGAVTFLTGFRDGLFYLVTGDKARPDADDEDVVVNLNDMPVTTDNCLRLFEGVGDNKARIESVFSAPDVLPPADDTPPLFGLVLRLAGVTPGTKFKYEPIMVLSAEGRPVGRATLMATSDNKVSAALSLDGLHPGAELVVSATPVVKRGLWYDSDPTIVRTTGMLNLFRSGNLAVTVSGSALLAEDVAEFDLWVSIAPEA